MQSEQAGIATFCATWIRVAVGDKEWMNTQRTKHWRNYKYHSIPEPCWSCSYSIWSSWYIASGIRDQSRTYTSKCPYSELQCHSQKEYSNQVNSCMLTFKVPVKGYDTQHKTNEREGTVKLVRREMHRIPRMYDREKPTGMETFLRKTASAVGPLKIRAP